MRKLSLGIFLLLACQAVATISAVQSANNWTCSAPLVGPMVTCQVPSSMATSSQNLLAVWVFWQTSPTTPYTAAVGDTPSNSFSSAVGPTVQSSTTTPTTAQVFYAKNILGSSPHDTITVTFTCPAAVPACASAMNPQINIAGVVMVEYSGLDQNNPLDIVNEAISNSLSPSAILDSGTASPANSNLEVFGAGYADTASVVMTAGSGSTSLQAANGPWGTGLVEDNSSAISSNNVLQRATICIGGGAPCPATHPGNWLMQMAVFRGATWTTAQGTSSTRAHGVVYADQFPGVDIGDQINHAIASLPTGGEVHTPPGTFTFATQISPTQSVTIKGAGATYQNTGTHCATTLTWNGSGGTAPILLTGTAATGAVLRDFCLNSTTALPEFIDVETDNTYLDHIVIDFPTTLASVAGIAWGYTTAVNDSHCNEVFLRDTSSVVDYLVASVRGEFKGISCRSVMDATSPHVAPTNDWQLGTTAGELHNFNCFACEASANAYNHVGIVVNYADSVNFFGLYCEQTDATSACLDIPGTALGATSVTLYGPRFEDSQSMAHKSQYAVIVDLGTATVRIDGGAMLGSDWTTPSYLVDPGACGSIISVGNTLLPGGQTFDGNPGSCQLISLGDNVNGAAVASMGLPNFGVTAGGMTIYTSTIPLQQQGAGTLIYVEWNVTNSGASTLAVNGLTALPITKNGTTAVGSGDLRISEITALMSDGSNWQIVGAALIP